MEGKEGKYCCRAVLCPVFTGENFCQ